MRFLSGLGIATLLLAACSTGSQGTSTPSEITIGLLAPMTGTRAATGQGMVIGATLAVADINAAGGVLGRKVKLQVQDDAGDPVDAVPAANKLISVDGVSAIIGPTSLTAGVVIPIAAKANVPVFMLGGGSEFDKLTDPHFFRMSPSDSEEAQAIVEFAKTKNWSNIALAFSADDASQALIPPLQETAKKLGVNVGANVTFTTGASSYRSELARVFASHPQAIVSQLDYATAATVFGEVRDQGLLSTPWIGSDLWHSDSFFKAVGGTIASGPIYEVDSSSTGLQGEARYLQLLKEKYQKTTPPHASEFTYDGTIVWALGVQQAGTAKWPDVRKGVLNICCPSGEVVTNYADGLKLLQEHKKINFEGASSTCDFDKFDNVYGPFDVLQYNSSGVSSVALTLTAQQIQDALK